MARDLRKDLTFQDFYRLQDDIKGVADVGLAILAKVTSTPIIISAPRSRATPTGSRSATAPSTSRRFPYLTGVNIPGMDMLALTAVYRTLTDLNLFPVLNISSHHRQSRARSQRICLW